MIEEFKKFIARGNVLDLAIGVVIGGAFSKIVSSLVDDIISPILGIILGGKNFSNLSLTIKNSSINYGMFIQNIIDFLIIAFCLFIIIKAINKLHDFQEAGLKKLKNKTKKEK